MAVLYERLHGVDIFSNGGDSLACPQNAGSAGTHFDVKTQSLIISNNNKKSRTDTVLYSFPVRPLWSSVVLKESARVGVPMQWSRIQVKIPTIEQFSCLMGSSSLHFPKKLLIP